LECGSFPSISKQLQCLYFEGLSGNACIVYKPYFPDIFTYMENSATQMSGWLQKTLSMQLNPVIFIPALIAFFLAFTWGCIYHLLRHRWRA